MQIFDLTNFDPPLKKLHNRNDTNPDILGKKWYHWIGIRFQK